MSRFAPKPPWLKVRAPGGERYHALKRTLRGLALTTVCEQARCPNIGECWRAGTATVMLLGEVCTRGCRFCAVSTGQPGGVVDALEPQQVARAVATMGVRYVVLTMVNRDDLPDGGAAQVAETVRRLHALRDDLLVEALVGDFLGQIAAVETVLAAGPDVFGHNVEVVRSQTRKIRDARCGFDRSLAVLEHAKRARPEGLTKSSLMVGIGERDEEVIEALGELRAVGVDIVTIGQYLQPSPRHARVQRFVPPEVFDRYRASGQALGFREVVSGPLVRSSYRAAEAFVRARRHTVSPARDAEVVVLAPQRAK